MTSDLDVIVANEARLALLDRLRKLEAVAKAALVVIDTEEEAGWAPAEAWAALRSGLDALETSSSPGAFPKDLP